MLQVLLTSDIINSKLINNFDSCLKEKITELNKLLKNDLITKINSSRGDEIQFILKFNKNFFKNIMLFRATLFPFKIRSGASIMNTNLLNVSFTTNSWDLNGLDFFSVRKLLDESLKKEKDYSLRFSSTFDKYDDILNSFFILNDSIINNWPEKYWDLVKLFLLHNDNKFIAKSLNLYSVKNKPTQTYYDRLSKSNIIKINNSSNFLINFFINEGVITCD